jgi:WD40 repeat protein
MIPKQLKILVAALLTVSLGAVVLVKAENPTIEPIQSSNSIRHHLVGHTDKVLRISFSPDGKTIASGSFDETVKLWSIDGRLLKTLTGHKDDL